MSTLEYEAVLPAACPSHVRESLESGKSQKHKRSIFVGRDHSSQESHQSTRLTSDLAGKSPPGSRSQGSWRARLPALGV